MSNIIYAIVCMVVLVGFCIIELLGFGMGIWFFQWIRKHGADKKTKILGMIAAVMLMIYGIVGFIGVAYIIFDIF